MSQAFEKGGRLLYVGAGAVDGWRADAAECPPTFGVSEISYKH